MSNAEDRPENPTVEKVKGKFKEVVGGVLGNKDLAREGELHQERADQLDESQRLEAEAEQAEASAELDERDHELALEQERLAAERTAEQREDELERARQAEHDRIERDAEAQARAATAAEQAEHAAIRRDERQAADELAAARRSAAALEAAAESKERTAAALDEAPGPELPPPPSTTRTDLAMDMHTIPRAYVGASLSTARLPLDLAARLTNHSADESWPPALAFDAFAAQVRQIVGSLIGDEKLEQQGRTGQARVAEQRDALHLRVVAEQTDAEAEAEMDGRRAAADRRRHEAAERPRPAATRPNAASSKRRRRPTRRPRLAPSSPQGRRGPQEGRRQGAPRRPHPRDRQGASRGRTRQDRRRCEGSRPEDGEEDRGDQGSGAAAPDHTPVLSHAEGFSRDRRLLDDAPGYGHLATINDAALRLDPRGGRCRVRVVAFAAIRLAAIRPDQRRRGRGGCAGGAGSGPAG